MCEDLNTQADKLEGERDKQMKLALEVEAERLQWEQQKGLVNEAEADPRFWKSAKNSKSLKGTHHCYQSFPAYRSSKRYRIMTRLKTSSRH